MKFRTRGARGDELLDAFRRPRLAFGVTPAVCAPSASPRASLQPREGEPDTMTRSILAAVAAAVAVVALSGTGCQATGVGDPCTPEAEYDTSFLGFDYHEVSTESADFQCFSRLCLVNHFQGRVSCPYGQDSMGNPPAGGTANAGCVTPFIGSKVDGQQPPGSGKFKDPVVKETVAPQCLDRTADNAVYCSCRCANVAGQTDDGAVYCKCPGGFECSQLYSSIGGGTNQGLTGAYCIKSGTEYNPNNVCNSQCSPAIGNCGSAQGVTGM
jgi:hypothetical protein